MDTYKPGEAWILINRRGMDVYKPGNGEWNTINSTSGILRT
ncbi:hypothetical protein [Methanobacterium sp.]|nr:hypothetical protein [Methanobacterium sp.]